MCIFSGNVTEVSGTSIYCRIQDGRQTLIYSMDVNFNESVAMILPIPVSSKAKDAVKFINLEDRPNFFKDLESLFAPKSRGIGGPAAKYLEVHQVGDYIASFVPHRLFFNKLNECFRLSNNILDSLPQYSQYGFVVFQLSKSNSDKSHYHPMGFTFPTKMESLFFPTVHVHDGRVPEKEYFDHNLYFQIDGKPNISTVQAPGKYVQHEDLVDQTKPLHKSRIVGEHSNQDMIVEVAK